MPTLTRSASRRLLLEEARAASANASTISAPAANTPAANAPAANAPTANPPATNPPAANPPAANASADSAPTLGETAPLGLMGPATTRRRSTVTGRFVAGLPQAGSSSDSAPRRARRGRPAPVRRLIRRSSLRPQAAHGRQGASSTIFDTPQPDDERGLVRGRNRSDEGPFTLRNPSFAENEGANDYQDQEHPEQNQPHVDANDQQTQEDHSNRPQMRRIGLREWARQPLRRRVGREQGQPINADQPHEEPVEVPRSTLTSVWRPPVTEPPSGENIGFPVEEPLEQRGNEAGEAMEWAEATNAVEAARNEDKSDSEEQRMVIDPCTSPTCPLTTTIIPHNRGIYLHDGELNPEKQLWPWGLSNPPPMIWRMARRLAAGAGLPGDDQVVASFVRNHGVVLEVEFGLHPLPE